MIDTLPPSGTILISLIESKYIDLMNPDPDVIDIEQIAHRLSHLCRWLGATKHFYSVAQHSLLLSYLVPKEFALQALLHDATEAYMGDLVTPLKVIFPNFTNLENTLWNSIAYKFDLPRKLSHIVSSSDKRIGLTEKRELVGPGPAYHSGNNEPYSPDEWESLTGRSMDDCLAELLPRDAKAQFLQRFADLVHNRTDD